MITITKEFTKEQLIEQAKKNIEVLRVAVGRVPGAYDAAVIHLKLAEITLASLEAEPVLYQSCTRPTWNSGVPWTEWKERSRECYEDDLRFTDTPDHAGWIYKCRKLYTTPPAPVIQADVAQAIENLKQKLVECNRYNYCADAVKGVEDACRAAMLHGAEPVSQTYKLPQTEFEQVADLYEMQFDDGRTCAFHTDAQKAAQWLQTCDGNRVQEYVKLERLQNAQSGNSPVTPDGWISCSERMPDDTKMLLAFSQGQIVAAYWNWVMSPIDYKKYRAFTYLSGNILDDVTHWMPLPEPPQEVK